MNLFNVLKEVYLCLILCEIEQGLILYCKWNMIRVFFWIFLFIGVLSLYNSFHY